jgi:hypothetical protein
MKIYIILPLVLLVGLAVGGWGTRVDLREAKAELKEARRQARNGGSSGKSLQIGQGVTSLLNIDSKPAPGKKGTAKTKVVHSHGAKDSAGDSVDTPPDQSQEEKSAAELTEDDPRDRFEDNINNAVELFEVRARLARATFIDRTELNEEQAARFDVLVDAMNVRLADKIETWVDDIENKETVGSEDGVRLVNGVTEAMVSAYDDIDRDMPEGWREKNDGELNITDFIDPGIAMPLVRVQNKMGGVGGNNRRPANRGIIF